MSTHNIGFYEEMSKIITQISSNVHLISSAESPHLGDSTGYPQQMFLWKLWGKLSSNYQ